MPGLRAVALAVAASVLIQDAALAAGPEIWRASSPAPALLPSTDGPGSGTPERWGHTTHHRRFKDSELIINVQDSHANLDAQASIGRVLDEFGAAYNIELIGLEGSEGRMDTDLVAEFPDERVRGDVAEGLLKKTMISAAEYRRILQGGGAELFGVEDGRLYRRNVRDYQRLLAMRATAQEQLKRVRLVLEPRDKAKLPPAVPEIHKMSIDHAAGRVKFGEYWERMSREAAAAGVKPSGYDAIASLAKALELEKSIDFGTAGTEREALIHALKGILPASDRARFLKELVLFKTGKMRAAQAHRLLVERARKFLPNMASSELQKYSAYLALYEKIDLAALFVQIRTFERELIEVLLTSPEERAAYARVEMLGHLERLFDGELTPDDHGRYLVLRSSAGLGALRAAAGEGTGVDWALLAHAERTARGFYARVEARNRAMLERLTARMREKGVRTAALVTGGFHAEGLSGLMERDRISHVVVLPHFDADGPERPYAAVITSKGSYLDRSIREAALAEVIALAIWSASVQGVSVPRAKAVLERNAQKIVRRQISEGRLPHNGPSKRSGSSPTSASSASSGRVPDRWIATASVLSGIDARVAVEMARTAEVNGDRIQVGSFLFKGLTDVSTTESGVRRRKASVRWAGRVQASSSDAPFAAVPVPAATKPSGSSASETVDTSAKYAAAVRAAGDQMRRYSGNVTVPARLNAEFDALVGMTLRKKGLDPDLMPRQVRLLADRVRESSVGHVIDARRVLPAQPALAAARMAEGSREEKKARAARAREEAKAGVIREQMSSGGHHWKWTSADGRMLEFERFDPKSLAQSPPRTALDVLLRAANPLNWVRGGMAGLSTLLKWTGFLDPDERSWSPEDGGIAQRAIEGTGSVYFRVLAGSDRQLRGYAVLHVETDDGEADELQVFGFVSPGASQLRPTTLESLVDHQAVGMAWAAEDYLNGLQFLEFVTPGQKATRGARLAGELTFRPAYIDYSLPQAGPVSGARMTRPSMTAARLRAVVALRGITDHSADDKEFNFMILSAQLQNYLIKTHQNALAQSASDWHDEVVRQLQRLESRIKLNRSSRRPVKETLAGLDKMLESVELLSAQAERSLKKQDREVRTETRKRIRRIQRLLETRKDYLMKQVAVGPMDLHAVLKNYGAKLIERLPKQLDAPKKADYRVSVRKARGTDYRGLWIDSMAVKRVMAEVVRNAFKYGAHRVVVRLDRSGDRVTVRFEDDGPGIPKELLKDGLLFRYGVTTGGTGLGLYEARELARSHGGDLTAANLKSRGAVFVLTIDTAEPQGARMAGLSGQVLLAFSAGDVFTPGFFAALAVMAGVGIWVWAALSGKRPAAVRGPRSAAPSVLTPRREKKSRSILNVFMYGSLLAVAVMAFETWYFSRHKVTPLKAEYSLLTGNDPVASKPRTAPMPAAFDAVKADRAVRDWVGSNPLVRQKVHDQLNTLEALEAQIASESADIAVLEAEAKKLLADQASILSGLDAVDARAKRSNATVAARQQDISAATATLKQLEQTLRSRRTAVRALAADNPETQDRRAKILEARAAATTLRSQAAEAEKSAATSGQVAQEYKKGGNFFRRLVEGFSIGAKGPVPEISFSPFSGMTDRKVGEAGSRGQQAEALVRAGGAREQAAILDQAASAQEAALRAFETVQSVTADDARDAEIGPLIRDLYDVDKEMRAADEALAAAKTEIEAMVSERLALAARQTELTALEAGRLERLKAARQRLDGSRSRLLIEGERLIVLAGQGIHDRDPSTFIPEMAVALLEVGTAQSDSRLLPFAAGLLVHFEEFFTEAVSNPAQRDAAQRLANALTAYFETVLASPDAKSRQSAQNLLQTLRQQMQRDQKERPLSSAILEGLLASAAPSVSASAPVLPASAAGRPLLLSDPGLEDRWSVSNVEHREEKSQIESVLEPIVPRLVPSQQQEIRDAFTSGSLASVLLLANSGDEDLAVGTVRQLSVQPEHRSLLFRIARDTDVSSRTRAAAIEGLTGAGGSRAQRLAPSDPVLKLLEDLTVLETKDPVSGQPKAGDPLVLSRLARLAGTLNPSQALPFLERILKTDHPAAVYAAVLEVRAQAPHPDAVRLLLDTLASGRYAYSPVTRERVLSGLGLWSDRSPVQHALVEAALDLSARFTRDAVVRSAIDEHQQAALHEHRLGFIEYVLNPARSLADPDRRMSAEDVWSGAGVWFYNRLDLFAAVVLSVAGLAALLAMSRKVRQDVEGERVVPPVLGYDDPHHPGPEGARMASLDLSGETEHILMQTLERRFGPANAEMIRIRLGHGPLPSNDAGWMDLFPDFGSQILSELRSIETNPIDLIEFRVQEWERILDTDAHVSPGELSASIFSLVQQLMIRLPRKFDYRNFYMKLDDTRDGIINIRMVARTVNALHKIDDLLRREWKMTLDGRTSVLDREQRVWALMAIQRQFMKAYRAFGAAQELFEIAHVAQTYNDYQMHPWLMRLFVFEKVKRIGIQLLAHGPRDARRPHLRGVLDDYYRSVGRVIASNEIERDVVQFFDEFSEEYQHELEEARKQGFVLFTGRVVGRRYRRLITVLMPAVGIAAGFLLGGPVFGLPALFRAFFLGSLGILASRWIHSESFYKPLMLNYEHYVSTVVDMLAERNRLFAAKFHISEHADGMKSGTYIESDDFVTKMLLNSTQERRRAVINLVAADRPADLLIVMIGDLNDPDWRGVQHRVLNHDLIARGDTPVVFVPDDPELKGSYYAFLKAHSYLAGGVSTAEVVQRFLNEPWFRELNAHLLDPSGTAVRADIRERLLRDHRRKLRPSEDPARVGVLYAGGGPEHRSRVADHVDEAVVRLHAGLLWAYHSKSFAIASEYADGRYAGPLPFYDYTQMSDLKPGEVLIPLTWVNADQVDRERSAVFLPDRTGRTVAAVIPGGLNADERRTRMNRAWMSAESPYTKFQVGSDAAQFLTDTGTFFFSPADGMLDQLRAQRERILTDPSARRDAQRQDQDGYTVERFFIGSLDQGSRVRLRTALAPPDATRYEHSSSTRAVRRDAPTPAAPPRPIEPPKFSVPAAAPTGPDLSLSRLPAVVPVPPAPITALPVPPPDRSKPVGVLSSITLPSSAQAKVPPAPVEPYKIQVRLDGAVVLSQPGAAINGQPVALNKLTGQAVYSYSIPGGPSYELRWSDPDKQRLLLTRDGSPVALNEPDAFTLVRLRNFLPSGARLALAVGIVADSEALFEERATAVNESVSAAGVVRPIDLEWVGPGETASSAFMSSNQLRDKVLLDEGAFDGPRLVDAQGMGSQIKSAAARETRVLETLLRFIQSAEARGQALDDAAIDAWMDVVTGPGALPAVEPMKIEVRSGGYAFRAAAELPRVSAETAVVKLATAFTGSDSYASARENALEAARSLEQVLRSAPVSEGPEDPTAAVRSEVSRALKKLSALRAASAAKRAELNSGFGPGIGEDGGKIYIEEALFMEDQAFFESEDRTLSERLRTAGKDIRRVIVVELTERWEALAPEERVSAYRTERNIRGDFDVMFLDPKDGGTVFGDGGKHHALLTRYASPLANSALPQHLSVIEPIRVESASYAGVLFAAARLLIEDNDRLPGMKKFAAGRYFYLPPLGAGDLLRALIGARLSAEAAATSA